MYSFHFIILILLFLFYYFYVGAGGYEVFISTCTQSRYFSIGKGPVNTTPKIRKSNAIKFEIPI